MFVQKVAQLRFRPDEMDPDRQGAAGEDGAANLRLWSFIGAYGVKRDIDEHRLFSLLGCFLDVQDGAALVGSALGAGVVGQLFLVAVGALRDADGGRGSRGSGGGRCGASSGAFSD